MPRKSKRSLSASQRWKTDSQDEPATKVQIMSPESSVIQEPGDQCQVKVTEVLPTQGPDPAMVTSNENTGISVESSAQSSIHSGMNQSPAPCKVKTKVKPSRRVKSSMTKPSIQSELEEVRVSASYSQDCAKYITPNRQCTSNAAVFLAFLHENENLSTSDLDLVLDIGDQLYHKTIPEGKDFLAADELKGEIVKGKTLIHTILTQDSMTGLLKDCFIPEFPALKVRLQCLLHEVQYALLIIRSLTIAVFRDNSGRFGFFDPHSRLPNGLPGGSQAVMIKFRDLDKMVERILWFHTRMYTPSDEQYELTPLMFQSYDMTQKPVPETQPVFSEKHTFPVPKESVDDSQDVPCCSESMSPPDDAVVDLSLNDSCCSSLSDDESQEEISVQASYSQTSSKYVTANVQCTANSAVFLAFLHENENLTTTDLNLVLDKGDELYHKRITKGRRFLAADDVNGQTVTGKTHKHKIITEPAMYGLFQDCHNPANPNLKDRLKCLENEVQYALLMMSNLTIAVFRDHSGRFGFFDPHSRRSNGFIGGNKAVMIKFRQLDKMIERIVQFHKRMKTCSHFQYELTPVLFQSNTMTIENPDFMMKHMPVTKESAHKSQSVPFCSKSVSPPKQAVDVQVNAFVDLSDESSSMDQTDEVHEATPVLMHTSFDLANEHLTENTLTANKAETPDLRASKVNKNTLGHRLDSTNISAILGENMKKLSKHRRKKYTRRLSKQSNQSKSDLKQSEKYRIKVDKILKRYHEDAAFKEKVKCYSKLKYRTEMKYKDIQKKYIQKRYKNDKKFKKNKITDSLNRYKNSEKRQMMQKKYIQTRYQGDADYKMRQKKYIQTRYQGDADYKMRQKKYIQTRYQGDADYKMRQKKYIQTRYKVCAAFKEKQKTYMTQRYAKDKAFRMRHKLNMRRIMHNKYNCCPDVNIIVKMKCARNIIRKYREINNQKVESKQTHNERKETREESAWTKSLNAFRAHCKSSPTFVCTVCFKASFENQVKPCIRPVYDKNPHVVNHCLTGRYVHICNEECFKETCKAPPERKSEWICHCCHNHLKKGRMAPLAAVNNLELVEIPPELACLNIMETHLVKKVVSFQKIVPLPKGKQNSIVGNVILVPSEINDAVNTLPRMADQSQTIRVKLKRKLSYKGHCISQTVNWPRVIKALEKLKEIHPDYQDIVINYDQASCDPLQNDNDDNSDDEMKDGDFDETDLMEIYEFEKDALCDAELVSEDHDDIEMNSESDKDGNEMETESHNDETQNKSDENTDEHISGVAFESCFQPLDISDEVLCHTDSVYCIAPAEKNNPVSFFKIPNLEAKAFPVQFPTGLNTFDTKRSIKLSPSQYFKSRVFSVDNRFARDTTYLFMAQYVTEIHFARSNMSIQLRKAKPVTRDGRKITSSMLKNKTDVEKLVRNKDAQRFMTTLRGTPSYWNKEILNLYAMIRQLGCPSFFASFSAAELSHWPEFIEAIKAQQGETVNFNDLDWETKCEILRSNPVTTMRMFDKRVEGLFKYLINSPAQPLGEVTDHYFRVEHQMRGSPHIHALIWTTERIDMEDDDKKITDFIDKYISAKLPDPDKEPELYKLVSEVQMHSKNHTKTCRKNKNRGCRFGFPQCPITETMITRPETCENLSKESMKKLKSFKALLDEPGNESKSFEEILNESGLSMDEYKLSLHGTSNTNKIIYKREPKDCRVNPHNIPLLKAWKANIDIQPITSPYACIQYICGYISKAESVMSEHLKSVVKNMDKKELSESDEMKEVLQAYSKKREVSAQEAVARLTGLRLKQCSRAVVFLPTDTSVRMSKPMSELENTVDSEDIWMSNLLEKYRSRPETQDFEEMCYADFGSTCRVVYGEEKHGKDVLSLSNDMGYVKKRTRTEKNAIIRYHRYSPEKNPEQFYGNILKLYLPHRGDCQLKTTSFPTYQSFYESAFVKLPFTDEIVPVKDIVKENREKYEKHGKSVELAIKEHEEKGGVIDAWCDLAPEAERERLECLEEMEERPDNEDPQENDPDLIRPVHAVTDATFIMEPPKLDPAHRQQLYQSLNQMQASVFYDVRDWCIKRVDNANSQPFFYYINGGAGTGKSHLIKCIYAEASEILSKVERNAYETDPSKPSVLLTAFTGTAAFNICGTTLHTLLKLPRSLKPPYQGLGNKLDEVRAELMNAEIIIIDEISMVSKELFAYVNFRLQQIKGTNRPFGGMSVLAVGDFYQLPPVAQSKPLCVFEADYIDLWNHNFKMITLTEIMRQKDDRVFAEMLNRIRVKTITQDLSDDDRELLSQTVTEPENCPNDVLHIFAKNRFVRDHNSKTLAVLFDDIITINADDYRKDARTGTMELQTTPCKEEFNGLAAKLELAIGARVMLTRNIDLSQGLVNGAFAKLATVVYSPTNPTHVQKLGLDLDNKNPRKKTGSDNLVYLERSEENVTKRKGMVRRQFPIKLAFACTIHKVQGMTTSSAVVSFKQIFQAGMGYVAVSRVTSLSGLRIIDMDESKLYANPEITESLNSMQKTNLEHIMPLYHLSQSLDKDRTFSIIHHNTQGLPSHIEDIKAHHELLLSDVLCLTETRLQCFVAPSLHLEGYTMYERSRHVSYTRFSEMASRDGGGVAIYVKNHIVAQEIRYAHNVTDLEFVVVQVQAPFSALIVSVYRPPTYNVKPFLENLGALLDCLEMLDDQPIIVCGDFNENLLYYGKKPIMDFFESKCYAQVISAPTTDRNTLLDAIYISRPEICRNAGRLFSYYSYHSPVFCILSI